MNWSCFPTEASDFSSHKVIPPGDHEVEETIHGTQRWLKLAAESWGNAEICWAAVQAVASGKFQPGRPGFFRARRPDA